MKLFDSVSMRAPKRNKFDLSHERKLSMNMGDLVPIMVEEIVPGDSFRVKHEVMMRLAPMLAPIMHRVNVKIESFFVPNRLIWDEWEDFITGGRLGTSAPVVPQMSNSVVVASSVPAVSEPGTLYDYLGMPVGTSGADATQFYSALPFRAYQLIWDEYYRDQNLTASLDISKASGVIAAGAEATKLCALRPRAWEKDYFTSCLPFAQRGSTVDIPLSDDPTQQTIISRVSTGLPFSEAGDLTIGNTGNALMTGSATQDGGAHIGAEGHGIDVNDLRRSVRLQEWLERAARVGSRYTELLRGFFGVRPDDSRIQRPEFLGGSTNPVQISEVLSTVQQLDPNDPNIPYGTPQGDMTGRGISYGNNNGYARTFKEHGWVISLMSVMPKTAYQQGIHRKFQRFDKFDYYWEQFANIGEQAVLNREVYYDGTVASTYEDTFGYQSRYAEYKYANSSVHGDFRSSLAYWHMGRIFTSAPALNEDFVTADPTDRIFAVYNESVHKLWVQIYNKVDALRPMPYYGTPIL